MVLSILTPILETIPSLRLRKDIWTHFPVCLVKLPYSVDGHDRYAIQWHQKNLDTWCQKIPQYKQVVRLRLLKSLSSSDRWHVESPKAPGDLCVIAMRFDDSGLSPSSPPILPNLYAPEDQIDLSDIENIKKFFPVCWKSRKNQHTLEYHNTFVRALAEKHGVDEAEIRCLTRQRLLQALEHASWTIEFPTKSITSVICTIHK